MFGKGAIMGIFRSITSGGHKRIAPMTWEIQKLGDDFVDDDEELDLVVKRSIAI